LRIERTCRWPPPPFPQPTSRSTAYLPFHSLSGRADGRRASAATPAHEWHRTRSDGLTTACNASGSVRDPLGDLVVGDPLGDLVVGDPLGDLVVGDPDGAEARQLHAMPSPHYARACALRCTCTGRDACKLASCRHESREEETEREDRKSQPYSADHHIVSCVMSRSGLSVSQRTR